MMKSGQTKGPQLGMLIDRTSFDETDDFAIDSNALLNYEEQTWQSNSPVVLPNGFIRRRMRWRPPKLRRSHQSNGSSSASSVRSTNSQASRVSRKSVHSFASTETQPKSNRTNTKRPLFPLPRPSFPKSSSSSSSSRQQRNTIGTEGMRATPQQQHLGTIEDESNLLWSEFSQLNVQMPQSSSEEQEVLSFPPSLYEGMRQETPMEDTTAPLPALELTENNRRVDLRIALSPRRSDSKSFVEANRPPRPPSSKTVLADDDLLHALDQRPEAQTPETAPSTDDENSVEFRHERTRSSLDEVRFSMAATFEELEVPSYYQEEENERTYSNDNPQEAKAKLGPVDLDDGSFLEVEKNLQAIHTMATEHLEQNEFNEALEVLEEILRGQLARYGEEHFRVGTAYHNLGICYSRMKNYDRAIEAYQQAIAIRKATLGEEHADVAVSLAQLGVAWLEIKRFRRALLAFRESLKIRRKVYGNRHSKVAKILNNVGCALYELDELAVAKVAFEEGLKIQKSLLRMTKADNVEASRNQLLGIASTQSNLASIKLLEGDYYDAAIDLEEALLLQESVLPDDHPILVKTRASLEWIDDTFDKNCDDSVDIRRKGDDSKDPFPALMGNLQRRLAAFRDLACGRSQDATEKSDEASSIAVWSE